MIADYHALSATLAVRESQLQRLIARLQKLGAGAWQVEIKPYKPKRTNQQNRLAFALYADIIRLGGEAFAGWDTQDVHEAMLGEFTGWQRKDGIGPSRIVPVRRSSSFSKIEFMDYVAFVTRYMAQHGIVLSLPDDPWQGGL